MRHSKTLRRALTFVLVLVFAAGMARYKPLDPQYRDWVASAFASRTPAPDTVLTAADVAHMPPPVRKYLAYVGAIGKPRVRNVRLTMTADMYQKPGAKPMPSGIEQYEFFDTPTRLFFIKSRMYGLPVRVLHRYEEHDATFRVRVAGLVNVVDLRGSELSEAETVTVLNDVCAFAPAALVDKRFTWTPIDSLRARVTFTNGPYRVSADLYFDGTGALVNFISNDRWALEPDGSLKKYTWVTPLSDYQEFDGRRVSTRGDAIWKYPDGDFVYGRFTITSIEYNVPGVR